ncbi:MAG: hypothetical protein K5945_04890 [Bacteroidaceae bacterium]|nr:hypothetical protein [Bacteroidaceae bacterium]
MTKKDFDQYITTHRAELERIREYAHRLHASVNQFYDSNRPYSYHLDMVAQGVFDYGHEVCQTGSDILPLFFGAWFHDSIEDARQTYNDTRKTAHHLGLNDTQAFLAAEIVYALTNDKGRTRSERAGERYYAGIRETPYAPFVKLCDRLANMTYSFSHSDESNSGMRGVYAKELPHFLAAIDVQSDDPRLSLPASIIERLHALCRE